MAERRAELYEFLEKYLGCMKENAVRMMDEPMPEADEELFSLFEKTGNRLRYEEVYFLRRKYLAVFGCLSILDGGEAYVKKLAGTKSEKSCVKGSLALLSPGPEGCEYEALPGRQLRYQVGPVP